MAPKSSWNPLAFVPAQVTFITSAVYIAIVASLLYVHNTVPPAPILVRPDPGVNITQAWLDLDLISNGFHPIDSRRNAAVKDYLISRLQDVLGGNSVEYDIIGKPHGENTTNAAHVERKDEASVKAATIWTYDSSNATWHDAGRGTQYGESESLLIYIRGKSDPEGHWWDAEHKYEGPGGILVNAHYDSVPSGYGATDNGVGVVTVLQLISHFTSPHQQPERGIVALLNNGEENGLYGAHLYLHHPLSQFTHSFLNLDGAGAGGRATLFRSTDAAVTRHYAKSPYPFGSVISADGFKRGLIRSATDYQVFVNNQGMRGLDVAFYEPRSRYHSAEDDARHTSPASMWHMLSASLATVKSLSSYTGSDFDGSTARNGRVVLEHRGSDGVWWDMFGRTFAVLPLPTLFALSVSLLTAAPVLLIVLEIIIAQNDKWYPFSRKGYLHSSDDDEPVHFSGVRGLFRFPVAVAIATAAVVALAYLMAKINPFIAYSSEYAVWAMLLTIWFSVAWFVLAGADRVRPTALQRFYCLLWLYILSWVMLVAATIGENNLHLAGGYFVVVYNAAVFLSLMVSYLEFFGLPTKRRYVEHMADVMAEENDGQSGRRVSRSRERSAAGAETGDNNDQDADATANESTSLLRGRGQQRATQGTFTGIAGKRRQQQAEEDDEHSTDLSHDPLLARAYGDEQAWSSSLPQWTWILQFLLLAPVNLVIVGQIALLVTSSLHQTGADGSSVLTMYLLVAGLTLLLLLPLTPFLHRFTYHIPTFLFFIFVGCLIYNLLAFPFSGESRMKTFFVQRIDLDTGLNNVSLTGLDGYVQSAVSDLPSAIGQPTFCAEDLGWAGREGLVSCTWHGLAPNVVPASLEHAHELAPYGNKTRKNKYERWLDYNVTITGKQSASFTFKGSNTKQYRLRFDQPVSDLQVAEASLPDRRFPQIPDRGTTVLRLLPRNWDAAMTVNVTWPESAGGASGQTGEVMALWSDANDPTVIPAFEEVRRFEPVWAGVTKGDDGLVMGSKRFKVR